MKCLKCNQEFEATKQWQKYCSVKCRNNSDKKKRLTRERQQARRGWLDAIKLESGCVDCGYKEHAVALDFDHIKGEKKFTISQDTKRSLQSLRDEIAKCEVVCSNCHRVRTKDRGQYA